MGFLSMGEMKMIFDILRAIGELVGFIIFATCVMYVFDASGLLDQIADFVGGRDIVYGAIAGLCSGYVALISYLNSGE